jgi:TRAP-type uncharacterized transport system substrate-binding protein
VIPAGTYAGQTADITVTTSLPVAAYTTTGMDDDDGLSLTKTFWEQKAAMAEDAPVVERRRRGADGQHQHGKLHPGAVRTTPKPASS